MSLSGFQQYLVDKGWKRYYLDFYESRKNPPKIYSDSVMVSSYGPTEYRFEHEDHPEIVLWWGLHIHKKPPVFCLSRIWIYDVNDKRRVDQDLWYDVMKMLDYDTIYDLILREGRVRIEDGKAIVED